MKKKLSTNKMSYVSPSKIAKHQKARVERIESKGKYAKLKKDKPIKAK